ncbi:hypothetical protein PIB30_089959 [Stylosanthes scabra]|uniref:Uncharacterized protein n=1 Tax=Stylosanthes scabra TaxID=79078 RepID=A0ABU6ZSS5_9FABA|nr:hypothetical protein [Stylosanthes scabra]
MYTTTLQLCTDGYYRRPRSTECTDGSTVGISNRGVGKIMAKLEGKLAPVIYKIISRQTAPRRLNNTDDLAVNVAAVVRSGGVVAFSDGLAVGNGNDGFAVVPSPPLCSW